MKKLYDTTSTNAALVHVPIEAAAPQPERKRQPKTEVRYRGRIFLCSGEKGGVGKTLMARILVEILRAAGYKILPIDADAANLDIEALFNLDGHLNLQEEGGYTNLLNFIENAKDGEDIVVSLPAGVLSGAEVRGAAFLDGLPLLGNDLNREVFIIWPIDDKELSVIMLKNFIQRCPGMRIDVVGNRFFFNEFTLYNGSQTKKSIEAAGGRFITLPRLQPQVMQRLVNEKLGFAEALKKLPIGARYELQRWVRLIKSEFTEAGYISKEDVE